MVVDTTYKIIRSNDNHIENIKIVTIIKIYPRES